MNNKYILKHWISVLPTIVVLVLLMAFGVFNNPVTIGAVFGGCIFAIIIIFLVRSMGKKSIGKYLKDETPDRLITYYEKTFKRARGLKDKDIWIVYNKSLVYVYFGKHDLALELLSKIEWKNKVPYLQSLEVSIRALISYLTKEYSDGLRLSLVAQQLGEITINYPGVNKSREFFDTYVQIGELMTGNIAKERIDALEERFDKSPLFPKVLIAWCLSIVYEKMNNDDKVKDINKFLESTVPFCTPFLKSKEC